MDYDFFSEFVISGKERSSQSLELLMIFSLFLLYLIWRLK
jgi:hypothetical protein